VLGQSSKGAGDPHKKGFIAPEMEEGWTTSSKKKEEITAIHPIPTPL